MGKTVVLIKPDAVKKGIIGRIVSRFEDEGFKLIGAKFILLSEDQINLWYAHLCEESFFPGLKDFMISTPVLALLWEGKDIISRVRDLCGPTDSKKAPSGTIRGDFGTDIQENAVHASFNEHDAQREIDLLFSPHEILEYEK